MKRILLYIGILAALFWAPLEKANVGELRPVQLVSLYTDGERVIIETDTKDKGIGETLDLAFENLKQSTPAIIYLDTADYLLVTDGGLKYVADLDPYLKGNVRICKQQSVLDPAEAAEYLTVRKRQLPKLKDWIKEGKMPCLTQSGKRLELC